MPRPDTVASAVRYRSCKCALPDSANTHHAIVGVAMLKVARRILMGTYALSAGYYDAYYKRAQQVRFEASCAYAFRAGLSLCLHPLLYVVHAQVRTLVRREMNMALGRFDALLCPAAPTTAYRVGEKSCDPLSMYKGRCCCHPTTQHGFLCMIVVFAPSRSWGLSPYDEAEAV